MLLTIHDANLKKVGFIDNNKQKTLNYYDDTWTRSLETGSSTFEFTVFKKAIQSDIPLKKTYNLLNERAFVSFRYKGRSYVFNVMTVEEDEFTIKCYCENLNLELINEYSNAYKAERAMSFKEYCEVLDLTNFTQLSIGINEISDQKRTLEWEGQDTKLARLLSLATKFDAEIDFTTELNADSTIKSFKVNVYHEYDDTHQGVGKVRNDIQLTYGKNLKSIKRKIDKTGIYTMIRPTGKGKTKDKDGNEVETVVTIAGLPALSENNADGVREFYQSGESLYAPIAAQLYPSTFTTGTQADQWIRKDMEVDSDNPEVIRSSAIANLRKNAYPALTYELDGFIDVEIGDTVKIYDNGFSPLLLVKARVSEQKISFTNPKSNKTTFGNFKALENRLSSGIQAAFERLFEAAKPYTIKLATDNGVIFKNQIGESLVTPTLYKGGKPVVAGVTWRWSLAGEVTTGMTYLVRGSNVTDTVTLTVAAYIGNDEVAVDEISLVNVVDGKLGTPGTPGQDGRTPYVHTAWANNETGTVGFSLDSSINKLYIGIYTDFEPNDSIDPKKYKWAKIKGDKGEKGDPGQRGLDGLQGEKGAQGVPGKAGADGRTPYIHFAYSESADGRTGFSTTQTGNKRYIGTYTDYNQADSTDPTKYRWVDMTGSVLVGARNLLLGTKSWSSGNWNYNQQRLNVKEWGYNGLKVIEANHVWEGVSQLIKVEAGEVYTFSLYIASSINNDKATIYIPLNDYRSEEKAIVDIQSKHVSAYQYWTRQSIVFNVNKSGYIAPRVERTDTNASIFLAGYKLERGNTPTDYSEAIEDIESELNGKADAQLTQEQLNALAEQAQIHKAELKAKASMEALSELEKAYQSFVASNAAGRAKSEKDLAEAGRRIELLTTQFGGLKELKTFIDTYMTSSNEGLIIGKNDASSTIKVSHDRISMFSAGKEVMYISQGVINIDNGIFTASVQVGRFREEQYHLNLDMNVIRYIK